MQQTLGMPRMPPFPTALRVGARGGVGLRSGAGSAPRSGPACAGGSRRLGLRVARRPRLRRSASAFRADFRPAAPTVCGSGRAEHPRPGFPVAPRPAVAARVGSEVEAAGEAVEASLAVEFARRCAAAPRARRPRAAAARRGVHARAARAVTRQRPCRGAGLRVLGARAYTKETE